MATRGGEIEAGNLHGTRNGVAGTVANLSSASQQILARSEEEMLSQ
jgi:hypothetical protein